MNDELIYLLKVNIIVAVFFLFYRVFLRKETFYQWNRYYFLLAIPCAFLFPWIEISYFFSPKQVLTIQQMTSPLLPIHVSGRSSGFTTEQGILLIMAIGTGILLCRLGIQLVSLLQIRVNSKPGGSFNHYRILNLQTKNNPFSFFQTIYINPELHTQEDIQTILKHEYIHVRQKHSFDILLFELTCAFCWYNPFVWLLKQAVRQNIEFYTDKQVLKTGCDRRHYQHELLKVSQIPSFLGIANNFNFNHLKQRIMMMNKQPSNRGRLLKYALIFPLLLSVVFMMNAQDETRSEKENQTHPPKTISQKKEILSVNETEHDFGTIKEKGGKVSTVFTITNNGEETLILQSATASCGCTTPEWTKEPIAKGKQGHIKVTYDPDNRVAPFSKTVTVKTNLSASPLEFKIKGTVIKGE